MREQSKSESTGQGAQELFVDKNFMENIRKSMSADSPSARGTAQV